MLPFPHPPSHHHPHPHSHPHSTHQAVASCSTSSIVQHYHQASAAGAGAQHHINAITSVHPSQPSHMTSVSEHNESAATCVTTSSNGQQYPVSINYNLSSLSHQSVSNHFNGSANSHHYVIPFYGYGTGSGNSANYYANTAAAAAAYSSGDTQHYYANCHPNVHLYSSQSGSSAACRGEKGNDYQCNKNDDDAPAVSSERAKKSEGAPILGIGTAHSPRRRCSSSGSDTEIVSADENDKPTQSEFQSPLPDSGKSLVSSQPPSQVRSKPLHRKLVNVRASLEMKDLWNEFNSLGTEMIVTKSGR